MKKKINELICRFFGHEWQWDFPSLPSNRRCYRCKTKQHINIHESYKELHSPMVWDDREWDRD